MSIRSFIVYLLRYTSIKRALSEGSYNWFLDRGSYQLATLKETDLELAQKQSLALASRFGLARFVEAVVEIVKEA